MTFFIAASSFGHSIVGVRQDGSVVFIGQDPTNTDYQAYLAWVAEGNTAEEWQPEA